LSIVVNKVAVAAVSSVASAYPELLFVNLLLKG